MAPLVVFALWTRRTGERPPLASPRSRLAALVVADVAARSLARGPAAVVAGAALIAIITERAAAPRQGNRRDAPPRPRARRARRHRGYRGGRAPRRLARRTLPSARLPCPRAGQRASRVPARRSHGGVFAVALEAAARWFGQGDLAPARTGVHAAIDAAFAVLNVTALRAEVARIRRAARARVEAEMVRIKEDARSYRLLAAPASTRPRGAKATRIASRGAASRRSTSRCTSPSVCCASRSTSTPASCSGTTTPGRTCGSASSRATRRTSHEGPSSPATACSAPCSPSAARVCLAASSRARKGALLRRSLSRARRLRAPGARARRRCAACWSSIALEDKPFSPHEEELVEQAARYACAPSRTSASSCSSSAPRSSRASSIARRRRSARR